MFKCEMCGGTLNRIVNTNVYECSKCEELSYIEENEESKVSAGRVKAKKIENNSDDHIIVEKYTNYFCNSIML